MRFGALATKLGSTPATLRRAFLQVTGLRPRELAEALRLARFKKLLREWKEHHRRVVRNRIRLIEPRLRTKQRAIGNDTGDLSKGRKGNEDRIQHREVSAWAKFWWRQRIAASRRCIWATRKRGWLKELREEYPRAEIAAADGGFDRWVKEIVERVEGKPPRVELPLDLQATAFQRRVWQELQQIPRGTTRTYTQVAQALGNPKAVRAVAQGLRHESGIDCGALPSRDSRGRKSGGLSLGSFAQGAVAGRPERAAAAELSTEIEQPERNRSRGAWSPFTARVSRDSRLWASPA